MSNISLATAEDKRYNIDKWARLFKSQTWEEIKMIAAQDVNIKEAAETIYQLSEDEKIRQECEAREDYLKRQRDLAKRLAKQEQELAEKDQIIADLLKEVEQLKAGIVKKD